MADELGTIPAFPRPRLTFGEDRICPSCKGVGLVSYKPDAPWQRPATPAEVDQARQGRGPARACKDCQEGLRHG